MTREELNELFEKHSDNEYLEFNRVENPRSKRPDLHAFLLLDELVPGEGDLVSAAEHDEYFIHVDIDELCAVITEAQVVELLRCGLSYDDYTESIKSHT